MIIKLQRLRHPVLRPKQTLAVDTATAVWVSIAEKIVLRETQPALKLFPKGRDKNSDHPSFPDITKVCQTSDMTGVLALIHWDVLF